MSAQTHLYASKQKFRYTRTIYKYTNVVYIYYSTAFVYTMYLLNGAAMLLFFYASL